jgi:hypothetical protein
MDDFTAKQVNLNRLYAQILKLDEDGKDFLINVVTQAAVKRGFMGMPYPVKGLSGEGKVEMGIKG